MCTKGIDSQVSIDTLNRPSISFLIDTWSPLNWHLVNTKLALDQHLNWLSIDSGQ